MIDALIRHRALDLGLDIDVGHVGDDRWGLGSEMEID